MMARRFYSLPSFFHRACRIIYARFFCLPRVFWHVQGSDYLIFGTRALLYQQAQEYWQAVMA